MRSGGRLICIISNTETADTPDSGQALLKTDEATIDRTVWGPRIFRTPGIVLGLGAISEADDTDARQNQQQEPHRGLLMRRNINAPCPIATPARDEARRIAANFPAEGLLGMKSTELTLNHCFAVGVRE